MFTVYQDILYRLLSYEEFRFGLQLFRALLLICVLGLIMLVIFHGLYYLGRRTPLYRKKPPVDGWNRRFFGAITVLLGVLFVVVWGTGVLVHTA